LSLEEVLAVGLEQEQEVLELLVQQLTQEKI
jgi:hypothetical protein